jgi:hypothetical protein
MRGDSVSRLTILPAPESDRPEELARWLRRVGVGVSQLLREAACEPEPDPRLLAASAWIASDLGAICEMFAKCIEGEAFDFTEDEHGAERVSQIRRLLRVTDALLNARVRHYDAALMAELESLREAETDGEGFEGVWG